jgi:hypothetical protein
MSSQREPPVLVAYVASYSCEMAQKKKWSDFLLNFASTTPNKFVSAIIKTQQNCLQQYRVNVCCLGSP